MEETAISLKHFYDYNCGIEPGILPYLVEMVSRANKRKLFPYKPIVEFLAFNTF
jgi:homocitrate synthase NifV